MVKINLFIEKTEYSKNLYSEVAKYQKRKMVIIMSTIKDVKKKKKKKRSREIFFRNILCLVFKRPIPISVTLLA